MKTLFALIVLSGQVFASDYLETLGRFYPSQTREELEARVTEAKKDGAFGVWRSFPPYFYHLTGLNPSPVIGARKGLCAGDAHIENFGFFPLSNNELESKTTFSVNDLDDATECPLDLDLLRLAIGNRLAGGTLSSEALLSSYQRGLKGEKCEMSKYLLKRQKKSLEGGKLVEKDFVQNGVPFCPTPDYQVANQDELAELKLHHGDRDGSTFLGGCTRSKVTGGSAGEKRFVILYQNADKTYGVYELKPLVRSAYEIALEPFRELDPTAREELFLRSLNLFFGPEAFQFYRPVQFAGRLYQARPRWEGNKGVKLSDLEDQAERNKVMSFEACTLGSLHTKSALEKDITIDVLAWDEYARLIEGKFKADFSL